MASLLKWLATNAINWDIEWHSALGTQEPQDQVSSFPHDSSTGLKQPTPASPPVTIMRLEPRMQLHVAGRPKNFLVDMGATYSVLISYSGAVSSQICTILGATGKTTTRRFTQALLCC